MVTLKLRIIGSHQQFVKFTPNQDDILKLMPTAPNLAVMKESISPSNVMNVFQKRAPSVCSKVITSLLIVVNSALKIIDLFFQPLRLLKNRKPLNMNIMSILSISLCSLLMVRRLETVWRNSGIWNGKAGSDGENMKRGY